MMRWKQMGRNYSQTALISKLNIFSELLEKKLEKNLGEEIKIIPTELTHKDLHYSLDAKLTPLEKLKIIKYRRQHLTDGYCLGLCYMLLSKLFLKQNIEEEFYSVVRAIINCPKDELLNYEDIISDFYFTLEYAHFPNKHSKYRKDGRLAQSDGKEILSELTREPIDYYQAEQHKKFSRENFLKLLNMLNENQGMRISAIPGVEKLIMGIFQSIHHHALLIFADAERNIYLYDSNYEEGEARKFTLSERDKIYDEFIERGYTRLNKSSPRSLYLNYDIFYINPEENSLPNNRTTLGFACW
jgi:hypothetical protein